MNPRTQALTRRPHSLSALIGTAANLLLPLLVTLALSACRTERGPTISERLDADGIVTRLETPEPDDKDELPNPQLVEKRMAAFQAAKASGTLSRDFVPLWHPTAAGFDPFTERNCPPEGSAASGAKVASNRLKNRITNPTQADIDPAVTIAALRAPGNDTSRWSAKRAASIECYVRSVKGTSAESCNCGATDRALTDTHIDAVSGPSDTGLPVIVEITPPWRLLHAHANQEDWSTQAVKAKYEHHRVRVTGWLFFDAEHKNAADNTAPNGAHNWRATCWEIHPVTDIQLVP